MNNLIVDGCNPSNWDSPTVYAHMIEGGVAAANATTAIWEGLQSSIDVLSGWHRRFREEADTVLQVRTTDDIRKAAETGRAGVILGWQNISPIENDLERLEVFRVLGIRIVQIAYNVRNLVANGCYEPNDDGLSTFGLRAVEKLNEMGMLIDLSHVGDRSSRDAIEASERPVAFTHIGLREYSDHPRNKPAELIRACVERGGVVGANAFPSFLPGKWDADLEEYLDSLERLVEVAGVANVGIASDFCEGRDMPFWDYLRRIHGTTATVPPEVPDPNPRIKGLAGSHELPRIAEGLSARGYADDDIAAVMGGNWLRLFDEVWT